MAFRSWMAQQERRNFRTKVAGRSVATARRSGRLCLYRKRTNISTVLADLKDSASRRYICCPSVRAGHVAIGAGEGIRTLDPDLGKVVLYP